MPDDLSLGRIQASFAQATQEFTVAAANLNFDFTLIKYEAPPEYREIGNVLSASRIREAETGPLHMTAQRLGALFDGICPPTPNLLNAYGTRASEIAKEVTERDASNTEGRDWIRMKYGGVDATSIWAAATSSKAALPVHMLACLIARMWKHTEATSVWVELIAERKKEIVTSFDSGEPVHQALASAVQQEITRDQIAKWDASARSWLQTADKARYRQYKQFLLIAENVSIAVHEGNDSLYSNVVHVWTSALAAVECLVSGRPVAGKDAPVLLGLSAWHIYPDMVVFNNTQGNTAVPMNDPLVRTGGVMSLGMSRPAHREGRGIYWSLSLAHHKFYGRAVKQTRRLDVDGSRMTFSEFVLVCLGSLFRGWGIPMEAMCDSFGVLQAIVQTLPPNQDDTKGNGGLRCAIEEPILSYLQGESQAQLAVSLGRRRPKFLPNALTLNRLPLFQMTQLSTLLSTFKDADCMIELLRRIGSRTQGIDGENCIIVCCEKNGLRLRYTFASVVCKEADDEWTVARKRDTRHQRWIQETVMPTLSENYSSAKNNNGVLPWKKYANLKEEYASYAEDLEYGNALKGEIFDHEDPTENRDENGIASLWNIGIGYGDDEGILDSDGVMFDDDQLEICSICNEEMDLIQRRYPNEDVNFPGSGDGPWSFDSLENRVQRKGYEDGLYHMRCGLIFSQVEESLPVNHAAIYVKGEAYEYGTLANDSVTLDDIKWCFELGFIDPDRLKLVVECEQAYGFLKLLIAIHKLYQQPAADGATITCSIIDAEFNPPIFLKKPKPRDWWLEIEKHIRMDQRAAIGLISYFETGHDVREEVSDDYNIIGLSGGDSIYVLTEMLNDPLSSYPDFSFTRILGNTGKAGFSLLVSPSELMVRQLDPGAWRVRQVQFDGKPEDYFKQTSLHLDLTDWEAPVVSAQGVGQRDADVTIIEAVVSVRDAGRWVADVDIHRALTGKRLGRYSRPTCPHVGTVGNLGRNAVKSSMMSAKSWDQVLDCSEGPVVVSCFNNWIARLAVVSVLHEHGIDRRRRMVTCPKDMCWTCEDEAIKRLEKNSRSPDTIYIF
ncbi:hypothetical protein F5Y04DRAFT_174714 [Hypomontagnella monticulosa]|nr:hypothetical protein F5Y04DRAFT_174714 [Hypomontagnella monticulosa]